MNLSSICIFVCASVLAFGDSARATNTGNKNTNSTLVSSDKNTDNKLLKVPSSLISLGPTTSRISLKGLDPRKPLTKAEAKFLETTVRGALNTMYQALGIDRFTEVVSLLEDFVEGNDASISSNNSYLRGGASRRKLPWSDKEMCEQQEDDSYGEGIPGCEFDIDLYMDEYCHHCTGDVNYDWNPDDYKEIQCNYCHDDDDRNSGNRFRSNSTRAPTTAAPSEGTSASTTGTKIGRAPRQPPLIYVHPPPPPTPSPSRRRQIDPNLQILWDLQHSPFSRFSRIYWVSLGGGSWP